jgi:hypothetical protein
MTHQIGRHRCQPFILKFGPAVFDRDVLILAGCDDYDIKPIEFDRLIGKIERLLGLAKIRARSLSQPAAARP